MGARDAKMDAHPHSFFRNIMFYHFDLFSLSRSFSAFRQIAFQAVYRKTTRFDYICLMPPEGLKPQLLISLIQTDMPFGKFKGRKICDLPTFYLEWFKNKGFPKGKIGEMLETVYEIKTNGLDEILVELKRLNRGQ